MSDIVALGENSLDGISALLFEPIKITNKIKLLRGMNTSFVSVVFVFLILYSQYHIGGTGKMGTKNKLNHTKKSDDTVDESDDDDVVSTPSTYPTI